MQDNNNGEHPKGRMTPLARLSSQTLFLALVVACGRDTGHPAGAAAGGSPELTLNDSTASLVRAIAERDALPPAPLGASGAPLTSALKPFWQPQGPLNWASQGNNPFYTLSGRINAVAYDPKVAGVWYVGARSGGVWKTTDSGAHWSPLSDRWPCLTISSIAVDPNNGSNLFVTTGCGLMKSADGGNTWQTLTPYSGFSKVVVDPDNSSNLIGITAYYAQRSQDGGLTWAALQMGPVAVDDIWQDVRFGPPGQYGQPRHLWLFGQSSLLYLSNDHGSTWQAISTPPSLVSSWSLTVTLAPSIIDPERLYLFASNLGLVLKLQGFGNNVWSWVDVTGNLTDKGHVDSNSFAVATVGAGSQQRDLVYAAFALNSAGHFYSLDTPQGTWVKVSDSGYGDYRALAVNPLDSTSLLLPLADTAP